jgi:hypothetical protein
MRPFADYIQALTAEQFAAYRTLLRGGRSRPDNAIEAEFTVKEWDDPPLAADAPYQRGHSKGDYRLTAHVPPE